MKTNNSAIVIPPPSATPAFDTNDIRPIRPPVEVSGSLAGWVGGSLGLALLVLALVAWLRWRDRKRSAPIMAVVVPPHVRAKQRLAEAEMHLNDPKLFCTKVSDAIRQYLEERFQLHAPDRTTEEFMQELQQSALLTIDQKASLADFLQSCDMVKFARFEPTEQSLRDMHDSALRLVDETQFEAVTPAASTSTPPELATRKS